MGTPAQNQANLNNSTLSTGPRTSAGKRKASQNAYKHGLRAERDIALREASLSFESRMHRWGAPGGGNDMNEFLLQDNVCMSFEIERARAALLERLRRNIENSDDAEQEAVRELGDRLYHVPGGNIATYGTQKWDPKKARTSWDPDAAAGVLSPAEIVNRLRSSAFGCFWLLDELDALRSRLQTSGFWVPSEKLKGIRILGRHPIDAVHDRRVADIFAASYALYRAGQPFDNLLSDMSPEALKSYVNRVTNLHRDLVSPDDHQKARQILIDLVEENIRELEEMLVEHFEKDRNKAQRTIDYHGFDESRTGDGIRRHWLKFRDSLERGKKTYLKYKEEQGGGRRTEGGGCAGERDQRARDAQPAAVDGGADGARSVPATGDGREECGGPLSGDAALAEQKATMVEIHAADVLACGGFLPERVARRACAAEKLEILSSEI